MPELAAFRKVYSQAYTGLNSSSVISMLNNRSPGIGEFEVYSETVVTGPLVIRGVDIDDNEFFLGMTLTQVIVCDGNNSVDVFDLLDFQDKYGLV